MGLQYSRALSRELSVNSLVSIRVLSGLIKAKRTIASEIEDMIAENPVILFSTARSRACKKAKIHLARAASVFVVVELESLLVGDTLECEKCLREITGQDSYPWVFVGGSSLGDDANIASLEKTGVLRDMCASAGTPAPALRLCRQTSKKSCSGGDTD